MQSDWKITKRHLGIAFVALGILLFIGALALDIIRGKFGDFGPTQQLAMIGGVGIVLFGLTLIPLGDRLA